MRIQLSRDTAAIASRKVLKIEHFASGGDLHAVSWPFFSSRRIPDLILGNTTKDIGNPYQMKT